MIAGLTGGIGSGKSTVARLFELLGCVVFESDKVAKEVYFDPAVKTKVIALLGEESYLSETQINTSYISSRIFSDQHLLQQLNAIIHPAVIARSKRFAEQNADRIVIKETALLFEAGLDKDVDKSIVVVAGDAVRIERVMERDGLKEEEVLKKMKSQQPQEESMKKADYILYNDETELLIPQVIQVYQSLLSAHA